MAYVQPHPSTHDALAPILRNGSRVVAVAVYAAAVATVFVLLGPVLANGDSGAAVEIPKGPKVVTASVKPSVAPASIATGSGVSVARLYALNPTLTPFGVQARARIVVGLR